MMARYEIITLDRPTAEELIAGPNDVCISITSPGADPARLSEGFKAVLRVQFHDLATFGDQIPEGAVPPHADDVQAIAEFALAHREATRLVVHCEAGISRSVAVALAIGSKLTRTWPFPKFYRPMWRRQRFVHYRTLFDALRTELDRQIAGLPVPSPEVRA